MIDAIANEYQRQLQNVVNGKIFERATRVFDAVLIVHAVRQLDCTF